MNGSFSLAELARELGIDAPRVDASFSRVSTDTRTLQAGDLYIALKGERFDGNAGLGFLFRRFLFVRRPVDLHLLSGRPGESCQILFNHTIRSFRWKNFSIW